MTDSAPSSSGRRPRVISNPHTAIPGHVSRQNGNRDRRPSDSSSRTRGALQATNPRDSVRANLNVIPELSAKHSSNDGSTVFSGSQNSPKTVRKRQSGPKVPPRTYESDYRSPTAQSRSMFQSQFDSSLQDPQTPPQDHSRSRLPPGPHTNVSIPFTDPNHYYLPSYHQFDAPPPKRLPLMARLRAQFNKFTAEPPILSPPLSASVSRRNSFSDPDGDEEAQSAHGGHGDEYDRDMFIRAIHMNGEDDVQNSLAADADVQLYGEPKRDRGREAPFFLQNLRHNLTGDNNNDNDGGKGHSLTYRDRRKVQRHRIVYNRDTVSAQHRFILTLARALLLFGSPSHRIEPQLASLALIFELPAQFVHTPGCVQISFGLPEQHSSETLLIKSDTGLDLGRIHETHKAYRAVVRDEITATEGRIRIEELLARAPLYSKKTQFVLTFVQGFILCGSSFGGSLNDMWVSGVLSLLVFFAQQRASRSELSSSGADIFVAGIVSLVARALSVRVPNQVFCYQSISSTGVAGMLPGSIMLSGVLDIASKNVNLGSSKVVAGLMTSLYLGFGLTVGSDIWLHFDSHGRRIVAGMADKYETFNGTFFSTNDTTPAWLSPQNLTGTWSFQEVAAAATTNVVNGCVRDPQWPWLLRPLPWYSLFVLLPVLNLVLSMKRAQPVRSTQMPVMVLISCTSTAVTQLANRRMGLAGHPDYTALLGSFVVSLLGNVYSRKMGGTAFTIMLTGIWLLIPTGLAEAGGLASSYNAPGEDEYTQSLALARKMLSVIIGVMSGVYLSARLVYAFGKKKNSAFVTF